MTRNLDLARYLELGTSITTWRAAERTAPVIVRTDAGLLRLRTDVPETRADCPTTRTTEGLRICGHVRCRYSLALTPDDGRPWNGPRNTLRPFWLESPLPPMCALDMADAIRSHAQRGMTTEEMARVLDCHPTLVRRRVKEGLNALKGRGVDVSAWQLVIDQEERDATDA